MRDLINQQNGEIIDLKEKCLQAEHDAQNYINNALEDIQAQVKIKIEREKADLINQIVKERQEMDAKERISKQKIIEFEARIKFLMDENDKLNGLNGDLKTDLESWKIKYQSLDQLRQSDIDDFKYQLDTLKRKIVTSAFSILFIIFYIEGARNVIKVPKKSKRARKC